MRESGFWVDLLFFSSIPSITENYLIWLSLEHDGLPWIMKTFTLSISVSTWLAQSLTDWQVTYSLLIEWDCECSLLDAWLHTRIVLHLHWLWLLRKLIRLWPWADDWLIADDWRCENTSEDMIWHSVWQFITLYLWLWLVGLVSVAYRVQPSHRDITELTTCIIQPKQYFFTKAFEVDWRHQVYPLRSAFESICHTKLLLQILDILGIGLQIFNHRKQALPT